MRSIVLAAFVVAAGLVTSSTAEARIRGGLRLGEYTDIDEPFVGGELVVPLTRRVYFNPNVEWVFVDEATLLTGNLDFHYDWRLGPHAFVWLGGGLAYIYYDPEGPTESDDDWGANLLAGFGIKLGKNPGVLPYLQAKLILSDDDDNDGNDDDNTEFVIALGVRF